MSVILSYIFYFIFASASPLQRRWLAKTKNPDNSGQIAFAFQTALVVSILSLVLPLFSDFKLSGSPSTLIFLTLSTGILGAGFYISSFIAQKHVEAGVSTLIANINTPITIFFSTLFLSEGLTLKQIIGTLILLFSIIIVSKQHKIGRFKFDRYFLLMVLSGIFLAFILVIDRALINTTGLVAGIILSFWSTCAFLGLATWLTKNKSNYSKEDIGTTGVLRFLQNMSWYVLVYLVGNLGVVSAVSTFKVVIMFVIAAIFLHEREDLSRKIFGSVVAVAGLLLMK
jgi:drug/metabolite transporter (DMT)-like permease